MEPTNATHTNNGAIQTPSLSLVEPLLNAKEAAQVLGGIPSKTVLQLAREGRLPSLRIGRHVRFVRSELEATLARSRTI